MESRRIGPLWSVRHPCASCAWQDGIMIDRYTRPEMGRLWTEEHKLAVWQEIEALVAEAWEQLGTAPRGTGERIRTGPPVGVDEWKAREQITHHDVAAFVDILADHAGEAGPWVHYGLTSSDVVDTAQGVVLRDAVDILLRDVRTLFATVKRRAFEHRSSVMVGRTHGIWAEPTTFGLKLATWAFELARNHRRLEAARDDISVGTISGAVGTYAHTPPPVEAFVLDRLGLAPEPAPSQITQRDRHAALVEAIALTGSSIERFATEIRHLQRSEVAELQEPFGSGQKGSSAMPHKRNPILSERMAGLARVLRGYAVTALENVSLWHERDISHSSAERIILPDATIVLDYMLATFDRVVNGMLVRTDRMVDNLSSTRGLVFSQAVLLAMVDHGMSRDAAYRIVQRAAAEAWENGKDFCALVAQDPDVPLDQAEIRACCSPDRFLQHAELVFDRLEDLTV